MRARRQDRERGAILVEFALVVTLLVGILFGVVEFGFAWESRMTVQNASRAGARVGSGLGNERLSDYSIIQSVKAALGDKTDDLLHLVVYKSPTANGAPPASCGGSSPSNSSGNCNVYSGSQVRSLTSSSFTGTTSCSTPSPDRFWCPTTRQVRQAVGADYLGIYIRLRHEQITGIYGDEIIITDRSVMRLEPGG